MARNFFGSLMASEKLPSLIYRGVFYNGATKAEVHDGALVVRGAMEDHDVYTGLKDINSYAISAPVADTDKVDIVDYVDVSHGEIMGVFYREGIKTFGLTCPAGVGTRVRIPMVGDTFYIAEDNFASEPTVGEFAVPTAGSTLFTPAAAAATTKFCVKVEAEKAVTQGAVNTGKEYFCRVVNA